MRRVMWPLAAPAAAALLLGIEAIEPPSGPIGVLVRAIPVLVLSALLALLIDRLRASRAEERRLAESVRTSQSRYRSLVELLPAVVYRAEFGDRGTSRYVSPQIETMLGFEAEEWVADERRWFDQIEPEDRPRVLEQERRCSETGSPLVCEYRMRASDGHEIWVHDEAVVVPEGGGPILHGLIYDITDQKRAEAVLTERTERLARTVREQTADLRESGLETVHRLAVAAEFRDDETHEHTLRVGRAAALLAAGLGLSADEIERIEQAAPLHDIGKLGLNDAILRKTGRLTPDEWDLVRRHPVIGKRILEGGRSEVLRLAAEIAHTHHERWDGAGYPRGLAEEEIPIGGRLTAVCDAFDVMTHERPYKPAWSIEHALTELQLSSGTQFDPDMVEVFCELDHGALLSPVERAAGGEIVEPRLELSSVAQVLHG